MKPGAVKPMTSFALALALCLGETASLAADNGAAPQTVRVRVRIHPGTAGPAAAIAPEAGEPAVPGAAEGGRAEARLNTAHLNALRVGTTNGKATWAAAWLPDKGAKPDPETGLLSRTEDLARIAGFHLDAAQAGNRPDDWDAAHQALEWLVALQSPDGRFYFGLDGAGKPSGALGFDWPGARAFWALGQGVRVLPGSDPLRPKVRDAALRALEVLARGGFLLDGSAAETAAVVLGLVELQRAEPTARTAQLIGERAGAIGARRRGEPGVYPYQAHLPTVNPTLWHAYGSYQMAALAAAGEALGNPDWIAQAECEASSWTVHVLASGGPIWGFAPEPRPFPQIAYKLEPQVRGLQALYRLTGNDCYGRQAGLFGAWLLGDNPAGKPMYDATSGRVLDGLGPGGLSGGAGAEATVLGLSVLQQLGRHAELVRYLFARESGGRRAQAFRTVSIPRTIAGSGAYLGSSFARMVPNKRVDFKPGLDGSWLVAPVFLRGLAELKASAALETHKGDWSQRNPIPGPADPAIGPVLEVGRSTGPVELRAGDQVGVTLVSGSTLPVALDSLLCQPLVEYRSWNLPDGKVALVKSLSPHWVRPHCPWPAARVTAYGPDGKPARSSEVLGPYGFALIESGG